jgi:hypothetical protein
MAGFQRTAGFYRQDALAFRVASDLVIGASAGGDNFRFAGVDEAGEGPRPPNSDPTGVRELVI